MFMALKRRAPITPPLLLRKERGAYVDHTGRWAWTVDSSGHESAHVEVPVGMDPEEFADSLLTALDATDLIPSDAFVPAPIRPARLFLV